MNKKNAGFTLIELMITVAIIGILASVAYPAYNSSIKKANRSDAVNALLSLSGRMEEYYLNNDTYVGATAASATSAEGLYAIAVTSTTAFAYLLTATPVSADPECTTLTFNSLAQKGATGTAPDSWR